MSWLRQTFLGEPSEADRQKWKEAEKRKADLMASLRGGQFCANCRHFLFDGSETGRCMNSSNWTFGQQRINGMVTIDSPCAALPVERSATSVCDLFLKGKRP